MLKNRGITDTKRFLNPTKNDLNHYSKLKNIDKAVKLFDKHIKKGSEIAVLVDSDPDGYTSSAQIINYTKELNLNIKISYFLHDDKKHGLTEKAMKWVLETRPRLLIIPDASSDEEPKHKILSEQGIDILILDHHNAEKYSDYAVMVNNQLDDYPNKQLSGAGITLKFLEAVDDYYNINNSSKYYDLAAFGITADSMLLSVPENRYIVQQGGKNINNPFLKELVARNASDKSRIHPKSIAFEIVPKWNAMIRVGTMQGKLDIFRALIGEEEEYFNNRTKKTETLPFKAARQCTNIHKKQKDMRTSWLDILHKQVEEYELYKNSFITIILDEFDKSLSGLLAGELAKAYKRPAMILTKNERGAYSGSVRGYDLFMEDTRSFLDSLGVFNYAKGHDQAFGIEIDEENLGIMNKTINEACVTQNFTLTSGEIDVDFITTPKAINLSLAKQLDSYTHIWGKGVEEPLFAVEKLRISARTTMRKPSGYTKWTYNGIDYVIFTGDSELNTYLDKYPNSDLILNVIGSLGMNTFLGKETPQFAIKELEVEEVKNSSFGF